MGLDEATGCGKEAEKAGERRRKLATQHSAASNIRIRWCSVFMGRILPISRILAQPDGVSGIVSGRHPLFAQCLYLL
ncbi:hypothetical protein LBMAG45_08630 [Nitrospirota bacterium]|nr:hypothetical protein LBMAG45_08630 [Nitrospirota bacterium]